LTESSIFVLPLQLAETFRVCAPTVLDAALGRLTRQVCDERLNQWSRNAVRLAQVQLDVSGLENVRADRAHVLMSNHQSTYDIFTLFVAFPHSMRMIAKKQVFALPIMGGGMRAAGFVELDRGNHQRALEGLDRAKEVMASGINIWIAPEGTRSDDGPLLPFKRGGFKMALQVQAPIIPITIDGTRDVLPSKDYRVRKGQTVRITFHPPVLPADYGDLSELMEAVRAAIDSALPKEMRSPPRKLG
jgi:1-acyl-sn-glycerol-3-phosphate acyltransferase